VPGLPEVQALAEILDRRLRGRRIQGLTVASIAALKTYDPAVAALAGREVTRVCRHGKFLDVEAEDAYADESRSRSSKKPG
jgi:formamidopyrimidine-DNA glycosylase